MMGRRTAAMLCVLLGHALVVLALLNLTRPADRVSPPQTPALQFVSLPLYIAPMYDEFPEPREQQPRVLLAPPAVPSSGVEAATAQESAPVSTPGYVDWPKEGKEAAARVLAAEAESERIAKMFAGPQGTWASLTKRQRSELNKFRWAPGVDGLSRDDHGNLIYQLPNGCAIVNFVFFGCPIGAKPPPHGDMFDNMREYFDEQRLPRTDEGNGTEPESKRPPKWSKPLP
jgi:hypothetical protein